MGMTLRTVSDNRYFLGLDYLQVRCVVIKDFCHFFSLLWVCYF